MLCLDGALISTVERQVGWGVANTAVRKGAGCWGGGGGSAERIRT